MSPMPGEGSHIPHCLESQEPETGWIPHKPKVQPNTSSKTQTKAKICYNHRLVPCTVVIIETSTSDGRWDLIQRPTTRHYAEIQYKLEISIRLFLGAQTLQKRGGMIVKVREEREHQENTTS